MRPTEASPADATRKAKAIEPFWIVIGNTRSKNCRFPRGQRQLATIQLLKDRLQTFRTFNAMFCIGALPCEKKTVKVLRRDRLNFRAQPVNREPMNSREQSPVAPFLLRRVRVKFAAENKTFRFEAQ